MICGQEDQEVFRIVERVIRLFQRDGYHAVGVMEANFHSIKNHVFPLCNYLERDEPLLNKEALNVISSVHDPDVIIAGAIPRDNMVVGRYVVSDITILIKSEISIKEGWGPNYEELIVLSEDLGYGSRQNACKVFRGDDLEGLYQYILHMFES